MKIISGQFQGRQIATPEGEATRPPLEKIRAALFNSLHARVPGARFLDLFAGSGSMGLEALSRAAASCDFVEADQGCARLLEGNIRALGAGGARVLRQRLPDVIAVLAREKRLYDIIFADPPFDAYQKGFFMDLPARLEPLLAADGVIAIRIPENAPTAQGASGVEPVREKAYGISVLQYLQRPGERPPWDLEE